jgi:hypothetical protein
MLSQVRKVQIGVILTVAISMVIVLCTPSTVVPAKASEMGKDEILAIDDFAGISQDVIDDASQRATVLFEDNEERREDFISHVLALYQEAKEIDVLVIVNSGGWGWSAIAESNEKELAPGIDGVLKERGNSTLWIDYFRTDKNFYGAVGEFMMAMSTNPTRAQELAARTNFLTDNLPDLKVILLGISNGCTICSGAMPILAENEQVYSIQLGPPVWNNNSHLERVLLLRTNGTIPDSFSHGDLVTIFRANLESAFGISQEYEGDILLYIGAPGHDYNWKYDWLKLEIGNFLSEYFSKN